LLDLQQECAVDVWQDTSESDGGANESIEFFVTTDGELEMAGSNALDLEILGSILGMIGQYRASQAEKERLEMTHSCELENFSSQIFEDCSNIDGSLGSNAHLVLGVVLQETLDTTAGELEKMSY